MLFILMISTKGGYTFHSAHTVESEVKAWERCKQADNVDTAILTIQKSEKPDLMEVLEKWN